MLTLENSIIYSVSQLNQSVRQLLELQLGRVWLNAEISNFSQPASGHWYFTLKDEKRSYVLQCFVAKIFGSIFDRKMANKC